MKAILNKIITVFIFSTCLVLSGCGSSVNFPEKSSNLMHDEPMERVLLRLGKLELPENMIFSEKQVYIDDRVYVCNNTSSPQLGYVELDTEKTGTFELPVNCSYIFSLCNADGQLAVLTGPGISENGRLNLSRGGYSVLKYSPEGKLLSEVPLKLLKTEETDVFSHLICASGDYILASANKIVRCGADGIQTEYSKTFDESIYIRALQLRDSELVVCRSSAIKQGSELCFLKPDTLEDVKTEPFEDAVLTGLGKSLEGGLIVYESFAGNVGIYSYDDKDGTLHALFKKQELSDMSENDYSYIFETDEGYVALGENMDSVHKYHIATGMDARTELRLACSAHLEKPYITDFNAENEDYYITLVPYENMEQLYLDLASDKAADIYFFIPDLKMRHMDVSSYFVDLLPLIDAYSEYGRETFVKSLIDQYTHSGEMSFMPTSFDIDCYVCYDNVFQGLSITMDELNNAVKNSPFEQPFPSWMDQNTLLEKFARALSSAYVDFNSGTCSFHDDGFVETLKACASSKYDINAVLGFLQYSYMQGIYSAGLMGRNYGENFAYVGFPNDKGKSGCTFLPERLYAISASSEKIDGAWQYIRSLISVERQVGLTSSFPVNASALEKQIELALKGELVSNYGDAIRLTEAEADKLRELIEGTDSLENVYIERIIAEEYAALVSGSRSAEETAAMIQGRVSIYMSEKYG